MFHIFLVYIVRIMSRTSVGLHILSILQLKETVDIATIYDYSLNEYFMEYCI